jgi:hypothetical protein
MSARQAAINLSELIKDERYGVGRDPNTVSMTTTSTPPEAVGAAVTRTHLSSVNFTALPTRLSRT